MTKSTTNSLCGLILVFFIGLILVISKDPFSDPGFSMFAISTCSVGFSFFLGKLIFKTTLLGAVLGLYSLLLIILLFLRLFTVGTFISSSILFLVIGYLCLAYQRDLNEKNIKRSNN